MKASIRNALVFVFTFVFIVGLGIFGMYAMFFYASKWQFCADYKEYEKEFCVVRDYVIEHYTGFADKNLFVVATEEKGRTLYDPDLHYDLELPEEVADALELLDEEAFSSDASLNIIRIRGNRVLFATEQPYVLVWSPDEKPTWLSSPDDDREISVKKAGDGWYHVVIDP